MYTVDYFDIVGLSSARVIQSQYSGENGDFQTIGLRKNISQTISNTGIVTTNHQWEIAYGLICCAFVHRGLQCPSYSHCCCAVTFASVGLSCKRNCVRSFIYISRREAWICRISWAVACPLVNEFLPRDAIRRARIAIDYGKSSVRVSVLRNGEI